MTGCAQETGAVIILGIRQIQRPRRAYSIFLPKRSPVDFHESATVTTHVLATKAPVSPVKLSHDSGYYEESVAGMEHESRCKP